MFGANKVLWCTCAVCDDVMNINFLGLTYFPFSQPETITGDGERGEDSPGGSPAPGGATQTVQSAKT